MKLSDVYMAAVAEMQDDAQFNTDRLPITRSVALHLGRVMAKKLLPDLEQGVHYAVGAFHFYSRTNGLSSYFPRIQACLPEVWVRMERSGVGRALRRDLWQAGVTAGDVAYVFKNDRTTLMRRSRHNLAECDSKVNMAVPFLLRMATRNLTPKEFRYDRAVGVEMECFGAVDSDTLASALPSWARVGQDGSIRPQDGTNGHEVRALLVRREMEPRLFRLCHVMRAHDLKVNASCGMHIHLDQRGESKDTVTKRARVMDAWLCQLQELVPASRRANNYCRFGVSATDRYRAVNLTAFGKYQTLEIRLHSGTVDYTKILAWIRLCELLAALSKKPKAGGCIATLEQLPLASHDLAYWRARHQELNPAMYSTSGATSEQEG